MTLLTSLANKARSLVYQCYVGGQPVKIISASWDLGYDVQSSSATITVAEVPSAMAFRQELEIHAGWDGFTAPAFKGEITDDSRGWFPFSGAIRAAGYLRRAQSKHPTELTFSNQNDEEIINALMPEAGITNFLINGEGVTDLGTVQPVAKSAGAPIIGLVNELDAIFSYKSFDAPDGQVFRFRHAGLPSATAAFSFVEGENAYSIKRRLGSVYDISNQVNVYGLPQSGITWPTTRLAVNPLVPDPPGFIAFDLRSSLIETSIVASVLAARLMGEVNGIPDEVEIETWGNPLIAPAMTISVTSAKNNMTDVHYWVKHIHQEIVGDSYTMRIVGERRDGDLGEESGKAPVAQFTYRISKETYEVGGVPTTMYTVTADGSSSWDPDSPPDTLTFAWANNKNADVGTDKVYTTSFTEAQMQAATKPTITLTVNDADASSAAGSVTKTIDVGSNPINSRPLYVAVSGRAEATPDGGATWNTWTPGAGTVTSTAPIAANTYGLFSLSNGKLMHTANQLLTAPTEAHDFGSQIDCIWVNEVNANRVTVGLANGQVHVTNNMSAVASSTWTQLADFASAVLWIEESAAAVGQYRIAMGNQILITFNSFATTAELVNFGSDTARNGATSFFANYYGASSATEIKREDGTAITGDATSDIRAVAHHIRDDVLYAVNTAGQSYRKAPGATSLTAKVAISSPGQVNHMINDGDNQRIFYVAAAQGLYKTFDEFTSVVRMRDYTGGGFDGLKVGRASLSLVNPAGLGLRVVVAGISGGAPRFGYTDDYRAGNWIANNNGLPGSASSVRNLRLDPFRPSTGAYLMVDSILYRNTAYRSGGSWAAVFDPPGASVFGDIQLSIASDGFVALMYALTGTDDMQVAHAHDGATFSTDIFVADFDVNQMRPILVGQWNADFLAVSLKSVAYDFSKSGDAGHTWSPSVEFPSDDFVLLMPYEGNSTQQEIFALRANGATIYRSTNQGGSFALYSSPALTVGALKEPRLFFSSANSNLVWGFDYQGGVRRYKSTNKALSFTEAAFSDFVLHDGSLLRDVRWYVGGQDVSASGKFVQTSEDYSTFTNRTGNLLTSVFTGASPIVGEIEVDFAS